MHCRQSLYTQGWVCLVRGTCMLRTEWHLADWVEHVIATDGEPYLQTPEDDIPLVSLLLLDVMVFLAACAAAPAALVWWGLRRGMRKSLPGAKVKTG